MIAKGFNILIFYRQYSPEYYGRVKKAFVPIDYPVEERDLIIVLNRRVGSRSIDNIAELLERMKKHGKVVGIITFYFRLFRS
jgi:hypothetical protein